MVHPLKRARLAAEESMSFPPSATSLVKASVSLCGKPQNEKGLSPGTTFGCRVAVQTPLADSDDGTPVLLASGDSVYHTVVPTVHGKALMKGKEGVAIPTILDDPINAHKIDLMQHIAEIQSLKMKESEGTITLGSVDSLGRVSVFNTQSNATMSREAGSLPPLHTYQLSPSTPVREPGWAGVALSPNEPGTVATVHSFARTLVLYEDQIPLRTIGLHASPTSVTFVPSSFQGCGSGGVIAATCGSQVGIWDVRVAGRGALVAELSLTASTGKLYDVQTLENGRHVIGATGADRSVGVWEPRKWTYVSRWNNCLKYEVHHLHFSTLNPEYCYVAGADYEVLCGTWYRDQRKGGGARTGGGMGHTGKSTSQCDEQARSKAIPMAFRGDARWLGLARAQGADVLAGLSSSGYIFVAKMGNTPSPSS